MLTPESDVPDTDPDTEVYLARGCSQMQLRSLQGNIGDPNSTAPTEKEAKAQVGEDPCFGLLIEFTTDPSVAMRFGTGGYVVVVKIKRKYLVRGSVSECGWIARSSAPLEILASKPGRSFV